MAVPAAGLPPVERDVHLTALAPEHGNALPRKLRRPGRAVLERRQRGARVQERPPAEVRAGEARAGQVALDVGRRSRAAGVAARRGTRVQLGERAREPAVVTAREAELAQLG